MPGYRKILVAYDGSAPGKDVLREAIRFARQGRSWVKVLAVAPAYEGDVDITAVKNLGDILHGTAERFICEAREIAASMDQQILANIEQGEAFEKIVDVADEESCDLIFMGRRGTRLRAFVGSVTSRVIGHTGKDVIVVPEGAGISFERVLVATDGSSYSAEAASKAVLFAQAYGSAFLAISVADLHDESYAEAPELADGLARKARDAIDDVSARAEAAGLVFEGLVRSGEPFEQIVKAAEERKAGLIIMGSHGRTGLTRLLMGSVAEKVIGHAPCPVLVVKPEKG